MAAPKPILVVLTLSTCPHSIRFINNDLPTLKRILDGRTDVSLQHVKYGETKYPEELTTIMRSVPSFAIVNPYTWHRGSGLKLEIYGMHYERGRLVEDSYVKPPTVPNLIEWMENAIKLPKITSQEPGIMF